MLRHVAFFSSLVLLLFFVSLGSFFLRRFDPVFLFSALPLAFALRGVARGQFICISVGQHAGFAVSDGRGGARHVGQFGNAGHAGVGGNRASDMFFLSLFATCVPFRKWRGGR